MAETSPSDGYRRTGIARLTSAAIADVIPRRSRRAVRAMPTGDQPLRDAELRRDRAAALPHREQESTHKCLLSR
jgi:hypothetical protein